MDRVSSLMTEVRDCINRPRKQTLLLKTTARWHMLCSCMDVIEDTELAIQTYSERPFPQDPGEKYLLVYGVLQALFSQQDAVFNLHDALGIPYVPDENLSLVREVRNDSIGHPTKRRKGSKESYHSISRVTMRKDGFQMMSSFSDRNDTRFRDISITDMIEKQKDSLQLALGGLVEALTKEEAEHRAMYKDQKLRDTFPDPLDYYFSKLMEATYGTRGNAYGAVHLKLIAEVLDQLKSKMKARGILDAFAGFNDVFQQLDYPMQELDRFFKEDPTSSLTAKGAYIYCFYVQAQFEELKTMAIEVDDTYQEEPRSTT